MKINNIKNKIKRSKTNKLYINIFCNALILAMLVSVFTISFSRELETAFTDVSSAIYRGNTQNNNISLMINVYGGEEYIPEMLEILEENNVQATFFIGGTWADKNADILNMIADAGQEIANHGYFHKDGDKLSEDGNSKEISNAESMIFALTGIKTTLFAPPSGAYNQATLSACESLGYQTIMWSKDTIDWRDQDVSLIYKRATTNQQNGDLILMHPTACTVLALEDIIKTTKENGFNLVCVSENIKDI
ncbi:MAG: polysaccharide deacetylase family protein [Bacillota bacterium]